MRIEIPVISRCGPKVKTTSDGAYIKNHEGFITWSYQGKEVTGKGIYVAACARSGTMYITKVLQKLEYDIQHEMTGSDGSVGYHLAIIKPEGCFHQVRHPLKQIASMYDHGAWGFMNQVVDVQGVGLLGCMQYSLKWNELLEEFCVWRYQLEQIKDVWSEFLERIGHSCVPIPEIEDKNERKTSFEYTEFSWDELYECDRELAQMIYDKHLEYGYLPEGKERVMNLGTTLN